MIYRLVSILERRGEKVEGKLEIAMDENGQMYFTTSSNAAKKRFLLNSTEFPLKSWTMQADAIARILRPERPLN